MQIIFDEKRLTNGLFALACGLLVSHTPAHAAQKPPIGASTTMKQPMIMCLTLDGAKRYPYPKVGQCDVVRAGLLLTIRGYHGNITVVDVVGDDRKTHRLYIP